MRAVSKQAANATSASLLLLLTIAISAIAGFTAFGLSTERAVAGTSEAGRVRLMAASFAADAKSPPAQSKPNFDSFHRPLNTFEPALRDRLTAENAGLRRRPLNASRFTGLWEVSAIAIKEELSGLFLGLGHIAKTLGLAVVGKGKEGSLRELGTDIVVGMAGLPKLLFDRFVLLVARSSSLEERVDAGTRFGVDIALAVVGARGIKVARTQASKVLYRNWSSDRIIAAIAKPRPKGLHRDFWNEMRVQRLQLVLASRIKSRIQVQGVRVERKYPWLTRKQYFEADEVANQLARTAVRRGDKFLDNDHMLRLSRGWEMSMAPAGTMIRPTGKMTLRKPPPRFFLPSSLPQVRVVSELARIAPMANWALGKFSHTAAAQTLGRTVWGNKLLRRLRETHSRGVQELDYRLVRERSVSGPDATLAAQSRALSAPGRVEIDASLRHQLGHTEAVDTLLFEASRTPRLAAALRGGATVQIRPFDPGRPHGSIRIRADRVEVSPGKRAFELEDDLDLERAVILTEKSAR